MLKNLDAVSRQALSHAHGDATLVPQLLRSLASSDRDERQTDLKELFACLTHQGTVYDATAAAVPFLFELLAAPATPDRNWIAFLLSSIADGKGYFEVYARAGEQRWRRRVDARARSRRGA